MMPDDRFSDIFRCITIDSARHLQFQSKEIPECREDEMLLGVLYAGICDTDIKIIEGKREYKEGIVPGHEGIAKVLLTGHNIKGFQPEDLVTFNPNHPVKSDNIMGHDTQGVFASHFIATKEMAENGQIVKIPWEVSSPLEAIFIEPFACAVHSLVAFKNTLEGKSVAIFGGDQFDKIHALVARAYDARRVVLIHPCRKNLEFARKAGIVSSEDTVEMDEKGIWLKNLKDAFDIVILATSFSMDCLKESLDVVKEDGSVILFGSTRKTDIVAFPGGLLDCHEARSHNQKVRIKTENGKTVEFRGSRKPTLADMNEAIHLLGSQKISASKMITQVISLESLPEEVENIRQHKTRGKVLVDMRLPGKMVLSPDGWKSVTNATGDKKNVAIIGATGDIGSQLSIALIDRGYKVMLSIQKGKMQKLTERIGLSRAGKAEILEGSVFSIRNLKRLIAENSILYDMSGIVGLGTPEKDYAQALAVNGFAKGLLASLMNQSPQGDKIRFLYPSSQRVSLVLSREDAKKWVEQAIREFDSILDTLLDDDDDVSERVIEFAEKYIWKNPIPENIYIYELTKSIGDHYVSKMKNSISARISHIYGEGYSLKFSIMRIAGILVLGGRKEEKNILLYPIYVEDLNEILIRLAELHDMHLERYKHFDIMSGEEFTKEEIVRLIKDSVPMKGEIILSGSVPERSNIGVDIRKAKELLRRPFTPLNRNTITRLVADILKGKNNLFLPDPDFPGIVAFDIGGTTTRVGAFFSDGRPSESLHKFETPGFKIWTDKTIEQVQDMLLDRIEEYVSLVQKEYPEVHFSCVAISFAGTVKEGGVIGKAASLWGSYENFPLQTKLKTRMPGWHFYITNDVVAAAWRYGILDKYKVHKKICIVTISSGVGYKIFDTQHPDIHDHYVASLGHITIDESPGARICECGRPGHLSAYASGRAAEQRIKIKAIEDLSGFRNSILYRMAEKKIQEISLEKRKKILSDKITQELLGQLDSSARDHAIQILSREAIGSALKSFYPEHEVDIAIALVIENTEFCEAINTNDPFALSLFEEITLILAREFIEVASSGIDRFILMGGFAQATRKNFQDFMLRHIKKIGLYEKDDNSIESLLEWSENDDQHGLIGVCNMVRYACSERHKTASQRLRETEDFFTEALRKESILECLREKKAKIGETLSREDMDLLNNAFLWSYIAHNILSEQNQERRFLHHSLEVAKYLVERLDITETTLLAAAFLHDTLEYSPLTSAQIAQYFHPEIASIVLDLSQNSSIQNMSIAQMEEKGIPVKKIAALSGTENIVGQEKRIALLATKWEHYHRLRNCSYHSRLLKVADNIVNYSAIDLKPLQNLKKRETAELEWFRFFADSIDLPDIARKDINYYIDRWLEVPQSKEAVEAQYKAFEQYRQSTESLGLDVNQLRERKKNFKEENGMLQPDTILFSPTGIVFGYPLSGSLVDALKKMQDSICQFFEEKTSSPYPGCIFYKNDMLQGSHITLVNYRHYSQVQDGQIYMPQEKIDIACQILAKYLPVTFFFKGLQIMADGAILAKAFVMNDSVLKMNKELLSQIPGIGQTIYSIRYVNLGRLLCETISPEKIIRFHLEWGDIELGKERFTHATAWNGQKLPLYRGNFSRA